mgnify:CR=1 FL=1
MYNAELKSRFTKEYTESISVREACYSAFSAFEPYEQHWGADLCTQSAEVLQPAVDKLLGLRSKSIQLRLTIYQEYVKWCIRNDVPGACDGMLNIDSSGLSKMRKQTVKNPKHLQNYLNDICDPESDGTADNTLRCYHWLAYAGMDEADIFQVREADVDLSSMLVRFNNTEYPLYREAIPAIRNCMTLTQFLYKHPNYAADKIVYRDRVDGDILIRGVRSTPSVSSMRAELSRRTRLKTQEGKTDLRLSYYRVWISGVFYRMYENELAGAEPDFFSLAEKITEGKTYKLDSGRNTIGAKRRKLAWEYMTDYKRWKMTLM